MVGQPPHVKQLSLNHVCKIGLILNRVSARCHFHKSLNWAHLVHCISRISFNGKFVYSWHEFSARPSKNNRCLKTKLQLVVKWIKFFFVWESALFSRGGTTWTRRQGGQNWILPKEMNVNRFFWDCHWLEIWSNHFCLSMGSNEGSVALDSESINISGTLPFWWH